MHSNRGHARGNNLVNFRGIRQIRGMHRNPRNYIRDTYVYYMTYYTTVLSVYIYHDRKSCTTKDVTEE